MEHEDLQHVVPCVHPDPPHREQLQRLNALLPCSVPLTQVIGDLGELLREDRREDRRPPERPALSHSRRALGVPAEY